MACIPRWAVRHPLDLHALHITPLSVCEAVGRAGTGGDSNMSYIVPLDACSPVLVAGGAHGLVSPRPNHPDVFRVAAIVARPSLHANGHQRAAYGTWPGLGDGHLWGVRICRGLLQPASCEEGDGGACP